MGKVNKTTFLILRVEPDFKKKVVKKAKSVGDSVSEFVRKILAGKV